MMTAIAGQCTQPYVSSKDPKIDSESMALIWECDGLRGVKATMYKDPNCVTEGSWVDFYRADFGPMYTPSDAVKGAVIRSSLDNPTTIGYITIPNTKTNMTIASQLNELHGCKPPSSPSLTTAVASVVLD